MSRRPALAALALASVLQLSACAALRVLVLPRLGPVEGPATATAAAAPSSSARARLCGAAAELREAGFSTAELGDRVMANRRFPLSDGRLEVLGATYQVTAEAGHQGPSVLRLVLATAGEELTVELSASGFSMAAAKRAALQAAIREAASRGSLRPGCVSD